MSRRREIPKQTIESQRDASDPRATVWVSAHAGSGKTHVLTQRVVRLLLEGAPPAKILCLTYTKAAAANMALRVFETLSRWTMLDDMALTQAINATGAEARPHHLAIARRLFARTVETPGGLKIQTIHAFCERLLHQFPFEANLPSRFQLLDEQQKTTFLDKARSAVLAEAVGDPDGALGKAVTLLSGAITEAGLSDLLREAIGKKRELGDSMRDADAFGGARTFLGMHLGLVGGETLVQIEHEMIEGGIAPEQWSALSARLARGGSDDNKLGGHCLRALSLEGSARIAAWVDVFFTQKGEPRGAKKNKIISAALQKSDVDLLAQMESERDRLSDLIEKRKAAVIVEQSLALARVTDRILQAYQTAKNARALVDFDDLIDKTLALLSRSDAGWVLYKLDSGIDHILIDEAQDTSPEQWEILCRIADEFSAGKGQRSLLRTIFAVGDEKQSIYSFQGARPAKFDEMRKRFKLKTEGVDGLFRDVKLHLSFRSSPRVLKTVDAVYAVAGNRQGLAAEDIATAHEALKSDVPGLVEIWDPVVAQNDSPPRGWSLPLDATDAGAPAAILANRIARMVANWLRPDSPERVIDSETGEPRPISAGDVIVLVRTRSAFFDAIIRAFKDGNVPVAGADRLKFAEHIAVMDLIAAGRASLLPQDDLTLACLLKSPLIGLNDDDLIAIAPRRAGRLIDALEASTTPEHVKASARLAEWRQRARAATPFMFYAHMLGADGGRRDLLARLGAEAGDAIDEFLNQALKHEQTSAPSLTGFLASLEGADGDVKRDMDAAGDAVRVMTVHAAKGLEAKIVILPDTCSLPAAQHAPKLFVLAGGNNSNALVWSPRKDEDAEPVARARQQAKDAEGDEYRRLLYVALTRAEERLYVMGYHGVRARPEGCWYDMIANALADDLEPAPAFWDETGVQTVLRRTDGQTSGGAAWGPVAAPSAKTRPPDWLLQSAPRERDALPPVRPSNALAAADQSDHRGNVSDSANPAEAARIGILMHALLQYLPDIAATDRSRAASRFLRLRGPGLEEAQRAALAEQALRVLACPALAPLFAPGARAEVALAGRVAVGAGRKINIVGQIDRLAVSATEVLIADFKTGRPRPVDDTPVAYVAQLALYHAALAVIYPGRAVRALLVWVEGPEIVELEDERLRQALVFNHFSGERTAL